MSVAAKMTAVMRSVGYLQKDAQLQGGARYYYLSEEKLTTELHQAFAEIGLVILPVNMQILDNRADETKAGTILHNTRIAVTYRLIDPDDGDSVDIMALGEGSDSGDKTLGKCMTAAYKYALRQSAMISTGNDPDATPSSESQSERQTPTPAQSRDSGKVDQLTTAIKERVSDKHELDTLTAQVLGEPVAMAALSGLDVRQRNKLLVAVMALPKLEPAADAEAETSPTSMSEARPTPERVTDPEADLLSARVGHGSIVKHARGSIEYVVATLDSETEDGLFWLNPTGGGGKQIRVTTKQLNEGYIEVGAVPAVGK